jgi:hypothetical protein
MKTEELLTEYRVKGKKGTRPRRTLWFSSPFYWTNDIGAHHGDYELFSDENQEDIYAVNDRGDLVLGKYHIPSNKGVSFYLGRPLNTLINPRVRLVKLIRWPNR